MLIHIDYDIYNDAPYEDYPEESRIFVDDFMDISDDDDIEDDHTFGRSDDSKTIEGMHGTNHLHVHVN